MGPDGELIFESHRRFEVWGWSVGHRGLLLRSNPTDEERSRIEVWFKPSDAVCLPSNLDTLQISRPAHRPPEQVIEVLGRAVARWEDIFTIRSGQGVGWVVAGGVHGREDDHEYDEPTMFDGWAPRPDVRTLFSVVRE
jgi:hypothetical protein